MAGPVAMLGGRNTFDPILVRFGKWAKKMRKGRFLPFGFIWAELGAWAPNLMPFGTLFSTATEDMCGFNMDSHGAGFSGYLLCDVLAGIRKSGSRAASFPPQTWLSGVAWETGRGRNSMADLVGMLGVRSIFGAIFGTSREMSQKDALRYMHLKD